MRKTWMEEDSYLNQNPACAMCMTWGSWQKACALFERFQSFKIRATELVIKGLWTATSHIPKSTLLPATHVENKEQKRKGKGKASESNTQHVRL